MKIIKKLILIFFILAILLTSLIIYWQISGLPGFIRTKIWTLIREQGVSAEAEQLKFGLFDGLVLEKITIRDHKFNDITLVNADRIQIKLSISDLVRGKIVVSRIYGKNCNLYVPLEHDVDDRYFALSLTNIDLDITNLSDKLQINSFSGFLDGVKIDIEGDIIKPTPEEMLRLKKNRRLRLLPFTCANWLPLISEDVVSALKSFHEFNHSKNSLSESDVSLSLNFPIARPLESRISFRYQINQFLYRGLNIEKLILSGDFTNNILTISDVRLETDNQEYTGGDAIIDFERQEISGLFSLHAYPHKLLKVFTPELLSRYSDFIPLFRKEPLIATVRINPSPISSPKDWNVEIDVNVNNVNIIDATIISLTGRLILKNRQCELVNISTRVAPDIDISLNGQIGLDTGELMMQAVVSGDPHFLNSFSRDKKFRANYANVWKAFKWNNNDKPKFELDLIYNPAFPKPGLIVVVDSRMTNFKYNGVEVDQATAEVWVDYLNKLVIIDKLNIASKNATANGRIVYHGDIKEIRFDVNSQLHAPSLMQLFNPAWQSFLGDNGFDFKQNPDVKATGSVLFGPDGKSDISVSVSGRNLGYREVFVEKYSANLQINNKTTRTSANIESCQLNDWTLKNVSLDIDNEAGKAKISGTVDTVAGLGITFKDSNFKGISVSDLVSITSHSEKMIYGDWLLNDVNGKSVYDGNTLTSEVSVKDADFFNITVKNIIAELSVTDGRLEADLTAIEASNDLTFQLSDITSKCILEHEELSITGTVYEFFHYPTKGICHNVEFKGTYTDAMFEVNLVTPYFICFDDTELNNLSVNVRYDNVDVWGDYEIDDFIMSDMKGYDVSGTYNRQGSSWLFQNQLDNAILSIAEFNTITTSGIITDEAVRISVFAERNNVFDFPVNNITASIVTEDDELALNRITGNIFGGTATGDISYNLGDDTGKIWLTFIDVGFGDLISHLQEEESVIKAGKLSCKVDLDFDNSKTKVLLNGNGKIIVEKGDLWQVPILSDFMGMINHKAIIGKVLPKKDIGKISSFSSTLDFQGEKVHLPDFMTDGNLIAISAKGKYTIDSQALDFDVMAQPLKPFFGHFTKLLPNVVVAPFGILLHRRLSGTVTNPKWEASIRDIFRTKGK